MSMEEARTNASADLSERGFRKIAWAFLKVSQNALFTVLDSHYTELLVSSQYIVICSSI